MNAPLVQVGRLGFRQEGDFWNAYYAKPETMEGAVLIGSILLAAVQDPARKKAFMNLMREVVGEVIQANTGIYPTWKEPEPAPEHERSGNA